MIDSVAAIEAQRKQVGVLVFGGKSKKEGVCEFGVCTWSCQ